MTNEVSDNKTARQWVSVTDLPACSVPGNAMDRKVELKDLIARVDAQERQSRPPEEPCQQQLAISFFFDGTGNNRYVDAPKRKTSNVARLYNAHIHQIPLGIIPVYIPGVGTSFPEVGDEGGTLGDAFALGGGKRIEYALAQLDDHLCRVESRATNPVNRIAGIHVAIFGFSRGATEARAFAIRLHQRLERDGSGWVLKDKGYPLRIYFMGLFDTVASVGISNTIRDSEKRRLLTRPTVGMPLIIGITQAVIVSSAFDHSESLKGHNSWATELRIPPSVEQCLHYTAAHEVRESFPLDTVRVGASAKTAIPTSYPRTCTEVVYPGTHSDVGGGYIPGEHGRNASLDGQLSQVSLLNMYQAALDAGVPLYQKTKMPEKTRPLFQLSEDLRKDFNDYMAKAGACGSVEQQNEKHLFLYYRWRKLRATTGGDPYLRDLEQQRREALAEERRHSKEVWPPQPAQASPSVNDQQAGSRNTIRNQADEDKKRRDSRADADMASSHARQIEIEDQRFIDDCLNVEKRAAANQKLSLHEETLLSAWRMPLLSESHHAEAKIIAFFDRYVHDSVAGFRSTGAGYADYSHVARPRDVFQGREPWV